MEQEKIQHLAVVRLSALGDVCHAMAVVQSIMVRYPDMKVTWITSPLEANLVRLLKGVNVVEYDKKSGFSGLLALRSLLKNQTFDALVAFAVVTACKSCFSYGESQTPYRLCFVSFKGKAALVCE